MTTTLQPGRRLPSRIAGSGPLDLRAAADIVDLLDLTAPEPTEVDLGDIDQVTAGGLEHLAHGIRRARAATRHVVVVDAPPLLDLLLTIVGVNALDRPDLDTGVAA